MNLLDIFQDLIGQVPQLVQPLISALAGAVPFIEGEGGAVIGILAGIHPVAAGIAAASGNFLCVLVLVLLTSRARQAVVTHQRKRTLAMAGGPAMDEANDADAHVAAPELTKRQAKVSRGFERWGVPGVSLLGPLLVPTQITATTLAALGVSKARILAWQAVAITLWTTFAATLITLAMQAGR